MHTILGAGGPVSSALEKKLNQIGEPVRLISRKEISTHGNTSWKKGYLLDYASLKEAAKGSTILYLTAGLVYDYKIWKADWPVVMDNAIKLAQENNA